MTELLTAAQMKAIETAAISAGEVTGLELMERAGRGVVEAVFEEWPALAAAPHKAVVLCGPGNNGGDGFVVARLLKEWGWEVEVFLYGDADKLPSDAKANCERWREVGEVASLLDFKAMEYAPKKSDDAGKTWIFDAIFGTGLTRPIDGPLAETLKPLIELQLGARPGIFSIDIPSGICADSGKVLGLAVPSEMIFSFHLPKVGHYLDNAAGMAGSLRIVSIGLPDKYPHPLNGINLLVNDDHGFGYWVFCSKEVTPQNEPATHKYTHGHALILSGGAGKTGAARLAARGALRIGAGVVTIGVPPSAQMEVAGQITALMLTRVADSAALTEVLQDKRITALCLGPGLGVERVRELIPVIFKTGGGLKARPTVLDADALSTYADAPQELFDLLHEDCVLTPHAGEFARLFPDLSERLCKEPLKGPAYSKVDATRDAAKRAGCVVLFKGADTVIAAPDGRCSINSAHYERSAPWLATAGAGDVLAGFITGLMARGFAPMQAAETAAWLHVECARSFGPGLIAEDLAEELPKVFTTLKL
jgi:hydroxyethylthiazole kinase-like uncharacterized protein yjeF